MKGSLNPGKKLKISKIFVNKTNGQLSVTLSKKKLKGIIPSKIEITYWR